MKKVLITIINSFTILLSPIWVLPWFMFNVWDTWSEFKNSIADELWVKKIFNV